MHFSVSKEASLPNSDSLEVVDKVSKLIEDDQSDLGEWVNNYVSRSRNRIAFDIEWVKKYVPKNRRVLDVGSAPLLLTGSLKKLGYDVLGVDIAPERFRSSIAALNITVKKCDIEIEKLPFPDKSFDGVVFNELFEHLRFNPIFTMSEIRRVMRQNAILLLSTPNLKSLEGLVNFIFRNRAYSCSGELYDEYQKLSTLGHMGHVREYTAFEVSTFLKKIGFDIKKIIYRGGHNSIKRKLITKLSPRQLRPYFTILATKS